MPVIARAGSPPAVPARPTAAVPGDHAAHLDHPGRRRLLAGRGLVVLATLGALALRLHALDAQPLWSDEGLSMHRAGLGLADLVRGRIVVDGFATTDPMPPLYFLLLAAGRSVLGDGIWAQRFVGAALTVAAVPLAWVAGRRLFGRPVGCAAAAATALAPFLVWYGQELRPYALVAPCVLAQAAIAAGSGAPLRRAVGWAAVAGGGVLVHPFAGFVALAQAPFVLPAAWLEASPAVRRTAATVGAVGASLALWRLVGALAGPTQVDFGPVATATVARQALAAFAVGLSPSLDHPPARIAPLALLATIGLACALADRRTRRGAAMTLAALALPVGGVLGLSVFNPLYNGPRHVLPALPAFLLLAAASARPVAAAALRLRPRGGAPLRRGRRAVLVAAIVGLTSLAAAGAVVQLAQLRRQFTASDYVKDDLRSLVADLAVRYVPGDRIVLHDALIGFTFDAEAHELGVALPWVPVPHFPGEDRFVAEARLLAIVPSPGGRIWFVDRPAPRGGFEGESLVQAADKRWDLVERRQYARMWLRVGLRAYRLKGTAPLDLSAPDARPVAEWSNGLALSAAAFERPAPAAGERLGLVTAWRTSAPLAGEAAFEVRLVDAATGRTTLLGTDQVLRGRDVDDFAPGTNQVIALRAVLPLGTPPGAYDIEVRLVDVGGDVPALVAGERRLGEEWVRVTAASFDVRPPRLPADAVRRLLRRDVDHAGDRPADHDP